jgi:Nucleotidyl transferase AbiEii toxin, Type IV TA system
MTFQAPALPSIERPIRSLIAQAQNGVAEVPAFPCVDPVETAADKLSALAWRICIRVRGSKTDDPTVIRHLHDLAALEPAVAHAPAFNRLLWTALESDTGRGGEGVPVSPTERFALMLDRLTTDSAWKTDYEKYVQSVSFALPDEMISFSNALAATTRLISQAAEKAPREDLYPLDARVA